MNAAWEASLAPDVHYKTAILLQPVQSNLGVSNTIQVLSQDVDQCRLDFLGHGVTIAAKIDDRTTVQDEVGQKVGGLWLGHEVLHVALLRAVARKSCVEAGDDPL